jgi:predicted Zn-dependent protease
VPRTFPGKQSDALEELGRAVSLDSTNARFAYVYAVALQSDHRLHDAINVLERARIVHPADRDLLFALSSDYRDAGDRSNALRYARILVDAFPGDPDASLLLRSIEH